MYTRDATCQSNRSCFTAADCHYLLIRTYCMLQKHTAFSCVWVISVKETYTICDVEMGLRTPQLPRHIHDSTINIRYGCAGILCISVPRHCTTSGLSQWKHRHLQPHFQTTAEEKKKKVCLTDGTDRRNLLTGELWLLGQNNMVVNHPSVTNSGPWISLINCETEKRTLQHKKQNQSKRTSESSRRTLLCKKR